MAQGKQMSNGRTPFLLLLCIASFASCSRSPSYTDQLDSEVTRLLNGQPATLEVAQANLLCSQGLHGSAAADMDGALSALNTWAAHVKSETERHLYQYHRNPKSFENSEAYFRALMLVGVLQQDMGVRYNMELVQSGKMENVAGLSFFSNASDVFLSGIMAAGQGSCASLPVLVCAVGRRLGYPLKLVGAKGHLFCRWEDENESLNLEVSGRGLNCYPDEHSRKWPHPISDEEFASGEYLKSMSPRQELACFLELRGACLMANGRAAEAADALAKASRLWPESRECASLLAKCRRTAEKGNAG